MSVCGCSPFWVLLAVMLAAVLLPAGGSQWEHTRQGWPVLTLPGDSGLTREEIIHRARVKKVEADIASFEGRLCVLEKGPESNQVHDTSYKTRNNARAIDLSQWKDVLRVDTENKIVLVEPLVKMRALVDATLKHGMLPCVLPEFKHITVGGAVMGAALESSSHMHGDFLDGCRAVELLLGDGTVAWCSRTERSDLFHALSGSYGTLGLLLSAEIQCQPAFPFVEIKYRLYPSIEEGTAALKSLCGPGGRGSGTSRAPFVDALALQLRRNSPVKYSHMLVMTADYPETQQQQHSSPPHADTSSPRVGAFVSTGETLRQAAKVVSLDKPWGLWFFEHASRIASRLSRHDTDDANLQRAPSTSSVCSAGPSSSSSSSTNSVASPGVAGAVEFSELAETASYLFRYDYGAFWMARPMV